MTDQTNHGTNWTIYGVTFDADKQVLTIGKGLFGREKVTYADIEDVEFSESTRPGGAFMRSVYCNDIKVIIHVKDDDEPIIIDFVNRRLNVKGDEYRQTKAMAEHLAADLRAAQESAR